MHIKLHKKYKRYIDRWRDVDIFLEGDIREIRRKYLIQSATEKAQARNSDNGQSAIYSNRLERLEYKNHCKFIQGHLRAQLNQLVQVTEEPSDRLQIYLDDITRHGDSLQKFFRNSVDHIIAHGRVGVFVDSPTDVAETAGRQRVEDRAYFVLFPATAVLNWDKYDLGERVGQLRELTLQLESYYDEEGREVFRVRKFTREDDTVSYKTYEGIGHHPESLIESINFKPSPAPEDEGTLGVPYIPFFWAMAGENDLGLAEVQQLSFIRLNKQSSADNIEYNQSFDRTIFKGIKKSEAKLLSENSYGFTENPQAGVDTIKASDPSANNASVDRLDRTIKEVGLHRKSMMADDTRQNQSAESKAKDDDSLLEWLDFILDEMEGLYQKAFEALKDYDAGLAQDEIRVSIERNYRAEDRDAKRDDILVFLTEARALGWTEGQKEGLKLLAEYIFANKPSEELEALLLSVDQIGDTAVTEADLDFSPEALEQL